MRKTLFYILSVLLLVSCSVKDDCKNRFDFISSDASIPIIDLDITKHSDSIRKELSDLYGVISGLITSYFLAYILFKVFIY